MIQNKFMHIYVTFFARQQNRLSILSANLYLPDRALLNQKINQ